MDNTKFVLGIFIVILLAKLFPSIGETGGKKKYLMKYILNFTLGLYNVG